MSSPEDIFVVANDSMKSSGDHGDHGKGGSLSLTIPFFFNGVAEGLALASPMLIPTELRSIRSLLQQSIG